MDDNLLASKQRELWIDILRGFGILIVVLGHASPPFNKIIYGFHMSLFFVISGYLWNNTREQTKYKRLINRNAKRYLIPYVVLCGINLALEYVLSLVANSEFDIGKYILGILYSRGTTEWMPNCSPLWFLTAIFVSLMLFGITARRKGLLQQFLIIVFGTASSLLSYFEVFKLPWNIDTAMMAVVFIYLGHQLKSHMLMDEIKKARTITQISICVLLLFVGVTAIYFNPIETVSFDGNRYGNVFLMLIGAFSICFVLFYFCYIIPWKGVISKYLSWLGQHTIFIMGFDYFSGSLSRGILSMAGLANWACEFVLKVIILTIGCIFWSFVVSKIKIESIRQTLSF